jgi:hypothetical protein
MQVQVKHRLFARDPAGEEQRFPGRSELSPLPLCNACAELEHSCAFIWARIRELNDMPLRDDQGMSVPQWTYGEECDRK